MSNYPLCEKYGLKAHQFHHNTNAHYVLADSLERLLATGVEVFGKERSYYNDTACGYLTNYKADNDTHQGLLIGYKPIEKEQPVTSSELKEHLELWNTDKTQLLLKRILEKGYQP